MVDIEISEPRLDLYNVDPRRDDMHQRQVCDILIRSRSFLYRQVRYLVGALVAFGLGKIDEPKLRLLLAPYHGPHQRPAPAPPEGLYLRRVVYPKSILGPHLSTLSSGCYFCDDGTFSKYSKGRPDVTEEQ